MVKVKYYSNVLKIKGLNVTDNLVLVLAISILFHICSKVILAFFI